MRGFPESELASMTAIPGTIARASPTERKGSARISAPGTAVTATAEVRTLVAERSGVTTTVSSCRTAESRAAGVTCADASEAKTDSSAANPLTHWVFGETLIDPVKLAGWTWCALCRGVFPTTPASFGLETPGASYNQPRRLRNFRRPTLEIRRHVQGNRPQLLRRQRHFGAENPPRLGRRWIPNRQI